MWSRVPGECSERTCASGTRPGTQRKKRAALYYSQLFSPMCRRGALGPGSALARKQGAARIDRALAWPGHESSDADARHRSTAPQVGS